MISFFETDYKFLLRTIHLTEKWPGKSDGNVKRYLPIILFMIYLPAHLLHADTSSENSQQPAVNSKKTGTSASFEGWYSGDEKHASTRKTMLTIHPALGFTTWALWLATNLEGERALNELKPQMDLAAKLFYLKNPSENLPLYMSMTYDNPAFLFLNQNQGLIDQQFTYYYLVRSNAEWDSPAHGLRHKSLAYTTTTAYALTAGIALLAPSRFETKRKRNYDSIFFHKGLALLHFAAMASLPSLGSKIEHGGPAAAENMQNVAWAGFGSLSLAMFVVYF